MGPTLDPSSFVTYKTNCVYITLMFGLGFRIFLVTLFLYSWSHAKSLNGSVGWEVTFIIAKEQLIFRQILFLLRDYMLVVCGSWIKTNGIFRHAMEIANYYSEMKNKNQ